MPIKLKRAIATSTFRLPKPNPIAGLPKGANSEEEAVIELTAIQREFRNARDKAKAVKDAVTDAGHYIVVTFATAERQREFLEAAKLRADVHYFVDGEALAKSMGIALTPQVRLSEQKRRPLKSCALIRELKGVSNE